VGIAPIADPKLIADAEAFAAAIGWDGVYATITDDQAAAWADWCTYHRRRVG